jgi:hypothetical protein
MNFKHMIIVVALMGLMASCKKDKNPEKSTEVPKKDTIYLLKGIVTNELLSPSPVTKTESFIYTDSHELTKHTVGYKSASQNFTVTFTVNYDDTGKITEVIKAGTKYYPWNKLTYSYLGNVMTTVYHYPEAPADSLVTTLNSKGYAEKVVGRQQQYQLVYDADGNITKRGLYNNSNPSVPTFVTNYKYDKKSSPFKALKNNLYVLYQAFNDIYSPVNNRISNNDLELYNYTYNKGGYPLQMVVVHSTVAVRKLDYTYTVIVQDKK